MIRRMSLALTMVSAAAALALPMTATAVAPTEVKGPSAAAVQAVTAAGITVSQLAPGWTVKGEEIVWPDGTMASLGAMAYEDCASGYLCFWENQGYGGRRLQFLDTGLRSSMADFSFNDQMSSWRNRRGLDARWYYNTGGDGTSRCITSGAANSDVGAGGLNFDNDEMSSFRIYGNATSC